MTTATPKHYRLTRRGEIVRDLAIATVVTVCLVAVGVFGAGLMTGWFA